jgi:hypothetical protein
METVPGVCPGVRYIVIVVPERELLPILDDHIFLRFQFYRRFVPATTSQSASDIMMRIEG